MLYKFNKDLLLNQIKLEFFVQCSNQLLYDNSKFNIF